MKMTISSQTTYNRLSRHDTIPLSYGKGVFFMVSGHLTAKRNRWYAVLNLRHPDGRRYSKWISTGLTIAGNKRKADERLQELRRQYSLGGDIHSSGILFTGYMSGWLKTIWPVVAATTYHSYQKLTHEICAYFEPLNLHLSEVTHSQIQDYYSWLFNRGLSSNSVLHYHAILHKALPVQKVWRQSPISR